MLVYEFKERLRTSDFDSYDRIKIHSLLDIFQDAAGDHAKLMNIGYRQLINKNLIWVLTDTIVEIVKDVPYQEEVIIKTWPLEKGRIDFSRNYEVLSLDGEVLVKSVAKWVVLNFETRKVVRSSEIDYNDEIYDEKLFDDIKRIKVDVPHTKEFVKTYKVVNNDVDHNMHMNNCKYVELVFDCLELKKDKYIKNLQISYIKEAKINDNIDIYKFEKDDYTYFVGYQNLEEIFIVKLKEC